MNRKEHIVFLKYVLLNILGMLGLSCYILADTYFVSARLGAKGLASLNLAISLYSLIHGLGLMIGTGGATKFGISRSRNEAGQGDGIFSLSVIIGMGLGAVLLLAGVFGAEAISWSLGARGELLPMTSVYLRTILCFSPCFILNNILIAFIRNDGEPRLAMAGMLIGSLGNIVLDYVFLFPMDMGMFGAAFATGFSPVVSMGILSSHFIKKKNNFHFHFRFGRLPVWKTARSLLVLGTSAFINELSQGTVLIIFNLLILGIAGNGGVAAYGIIANLALVAVAVFTGISQGSQPLISYHYGRGEDKKARSIYKSMAVLAAGAGLFIILMAYGFTESLVAVFNSEGNKELGDIAFSGLRLYFLGFAFAGINIVSAAFYSASEHAAASALIAVTRGFAAIIVFAAVLSRLFGLTGIWLAFPASEAVTLAITAGAYIKLKRKKISVQGSLRDL